MALRGRKPKPPALRVVDGNAARRPVNLDAPEADGTLVKPKYLRGRAAELWAENAPRLWWLGEVDSHKLAMWCAMQAEFERSPKNMVASRIAQLRALGSEIGMDPASRSRIGANGGNGKKKKPAEEYFD